MATIPRPAHRQWRSLRHDAITAAHPTLPMPSYVEVTNLANRKSLIVRVNDRGPFTAVGVMTLERAGGVSRLPRTTASRAYTSNMWAAPLEGSDDRQNWSPRCVKASPRPRR